MKAGRRTEYEIYWEILSYCKQGRTFTQVIGRCDLNSKIGQEYINFLSKKGYLSRIDDGGRNLYSTTEEADDYLILFMRIYQELFNNSPEFKL
jgi:predicted transcriptional regulator